jgi:hypothetical protein
MNCHKRARPPIQPAARVQAIGRLDRPLGIATRSANLRRRVAGTLRRRRGPVRRQSVWNHPAALRCGYARGRDDRELQPSEHAAVRHDANGRRRQRAREELQPVAMQHSLPQPAVTTRGAPFLSVYPYRLPSANTSSCGRGLLSRRQPTTPARCSPPRTLPAESTHSQVRYRGRPDQTGSTGRLALRMHRLLPDQSCMLVRSKCNARPESQSD